MRHRHRRVLVRHHDRPRHRPVAALGARERLDQRREIGAGIDEQIVDPVRGKSIQLILGGHPVLHLPIHHRSPEPDPAEASAVLWPGTSRASPARVAGEAGRSESGTRLPAGTGP